MDLTRHILLLVFWSSIAIVVYSYIVYPVLIWLAAWKWPKRVEKSDPAPASVSFVVAARNEGTRVRQRVDELLKQLEAANVHGEVILVFDGPQQPEGPIPPLLADERVHLLQTNEHVGKSVAISIGIRRAQFEIVAFADMRQKWSDDALDRLLSNFEDAEIGAVSGQLVLQSREGLLEGVGLYWRYETWLRYKESCFDSVVGVTGAIAAVRRSLFANIPDGTILDDVYWPMNVIAAGYRVVYDPNAIAYDRLPDRTRDEFRRKLRTLSGNFQLMTLLPRIMLPWRNRIWWQFVSHKILRLAVPWALLAVFLGSGLLRSGAFGYFFLAQCIGYIFILLAILSGLAGRVRLTAAISSFLLLNFAAWLAFWIWVSGNTSRCWSPVAYRDPE